MYLFLAVSRASLIAQLVKNPPAVQETLVRFLGQGEPLEKGKTTHSSILGASLVAQLVKNPLAVWVDLGSIPGLGRSPGEGKAYPLQCSGLENSMDSPWGLKESDTTERLSLTHCFGCAGSLLLHRLFSGCGKRGLLSSSVHRLLIAVASPIAVAPGL